MIPGKGGQVVGLRKLRDGDPCRLLLVLNEKILPTRGFPRETVLGIFFGQKTPGQHPNKLIFKGVVMEVSILKLLGLESSNTVTLSQVAAFFVKESPQ